VKDLAVGRTFTRCFAYILATLLFNVSSVKDAKRDGRESVDR